MELFTENWFLVVVLVAILSSTYYAIFYFLKKSKQDKLNKIKSWALVAVIEAERILGSGTGEAKLSFVYTLFTEKFKWLSLVLPYSLFEKLVNESLSQMKEMLKHEEKGRLHSYIYENTALLNTMTEMTSIEKTKN